MGRGKGQRGKANGSGVELRASKPNWKQGNIAPATFEVPIVEAHEQRLKR
jgi:hypothetical protein